MELDELKLKKRIKEILVHLADQVPVSRSDFWTLVGETVDELEDETYHPETKRPKLVVIK